MHISRKEARACGECLVGERLMGERLVGESATGCDQLKKQVFYGTIELSILRPIEGNGTIPLSILRTIFMIGQKRCRKMAQSPLVSCVQFLCWHNPP